MTLYRYKGSTVGTSRLNNLLADVMYDNADDYADAWQTWFENYLESLDMGMLWAEFASDYLAENWEEVLAVHMGRGDIEEAEA